ncbi:MAG: MFS transporter [Dehalococcoidales bacterium]|nr:MAG: MFS transporter [Dehalococcoidales bacterium]
MPVRLKNGIFYGWIIVAVFLVIQAVMMGIASSFTIFFKSIEAEFELTRMATSAISSVSMVLIPISGFIGGWALDRYGPRIVLFVMGLITGLSLVLTSRTGAAWQVFLTYSVLLAIGMGPVYVVATSTVSRWFNKKRGLAVGIAGSGEGLGTITMAPLSNFLITKFSWKTAYLIIGLITWAVVIPLSRLLKKEPGEIGALPDGVEPEEDDMPEANSDVDIQGSGLTLAETLKTRGFWAVAGIWFFFSFCMSMLFTHIVPHVTDIGITATEGAMIISVMGAARVGGMIGLGIVADRIGRKKVAIVSTLVMAGAMLWLVWVQDLWMFFVFAVIYGLGNGGLFSGVTALLGDTFGLDRLGSILGLLEIGWGIGAATGPLIGGFIFDTSASYSLAFILGAGSMAAITFLVIMLRPVSSRQYEQAGNKGQAR